MVRSPKHDRRLHLFKAGLVTANGVSILIGIIYVTTSNSHSMWNIFGALLLLTFLGNVLVTLAASKQHTVDFIYLILTIVSMLIIPNMNRAVSIDVTNMQSRSFLSIFLIFSLLLLGGAIAIQKLRYHARPIYLPDNEHLQKISRSKTVWKFILVGLLLIILLLGIYLSNQLLVGRSRDLVEIFFPQYSLFFGIIFLTVSILIVKIFPNSSKVIKFFVIVSGITLSAILSLPLLTTPFTYYNANSAYIEAFDSDPNDFIPEEEQKHFLQTSFSLADYFFGAASGAYRVEEDILYYEGTVGVDQGILLHFDAYMPPADQGNLPGNNAVLVRIHGGGWTAGDKGSSNGAQVNKYFANQGYVVFDVQYGLSHEQKLFEFSKVPENMVAGFTIDDMVRHLGLFTDYLAEHRTEYGANLDSVFISGGSAGGQLATAVGLGLAHGDYDYLNPALNVKGIIPIYPANGLPEVVEIEGSDELTDPSLLVTEDSPPALIYHGKHDGVVDQSVAIAFDQTYEEHGNPHSALILFPFAGHSSNGYFPGYYNQVFMYYMERFMYQFK
ncbi:acetyl esterase/lipase/uncharacterized integral membrane protein [Virgibacillus natechei]|uniref:Acetyl esterase/lipase/uncharacterized integral membrane protein n=1 Tax=Virgibacillus natechei TaxID=1216297 RepID=A0ABS4IGV9_9BACI|nr:alpha/beta hydrolase [Virgibacillus natechei]MBP1970173.1 acetyl esterase/lipase/uncharacterized integral membrane protein [Virgibacillus natechei]UZD12874.1 alpha/beta hydrolase [Virgibacillus natechei]